MRERKREKCSLTRELVLLVLRPSFLPPFLSFSSFLFLLSKDSLLAPFVPHAQLSLFLSFSSSSCVLRSVIAHESLLGLAHFPSLPRRMSFFFLGGSRIPRCPFSFLPSSYSPAGGSFSIRVHTRESISPPQPSSPPTVLPSPFSSSFFVPVDRGVLHSSNLNAGRTGVSYRLRK